MKGGDIEMSQLCSICQSANETRHLPIYISGSEGIEICHDCEMGIVEYLRNIIRTCYKSRMQLAKDLKKIREEGT